jgi:hypothetical protein
MCHTSIDLCFTGINILYRYVSMEALHNSGERFPEPACHPGTRIAVLDQLKTWSLDTSADSNLLWLHGSAGVGKSSIAQMFASDCETRGRLGASFFFKRGHVKRGTWNNLFTTIAYQLTISIPELFPAIQQAMEQDKLVVGRSLAVQFQKLLAEPIKNAPAIQFLPILVLDGLDECQDHKVQQQILSLFIEAICTGHFPIRILIASRPEPHLREILQTEQTSAICRHSELSADKAAYDDIRTYLQDKLSGIQSEYSARGINLGATWPPAGALDHLVQKSSGIFIYATTVIKFIDDEYFHPDDRLVSVLRLDPESTTRLDDLYTQILSLIPQTPHLLLILHAIWQSTQTDYEPLWCALDPEEIDMLLDLRPGECRLTLRGLHSLFYIPPIRTRLADRYGISFLHASVGDFLCDSRRSGRRCVSTPQLESDYLNSTIQLLSSAPQTYNAWEFYRYEYCP